MRGDGRGRRPARARKPCAALLRLRVGAARGARCHGARRGPATGSRARGRAGFGPSRGILGTLGVALTVHALSTAGGAHVATSEDIGRHNAVDKVIGARLRIGAFPLDGHVLAVSGRASFEIVPKAIAARLPVVAAVSAVSSLAIELAARANLTLLGFARGGAATVYTGHERLR